MNVFMINRLSIDENTNAVVILDCKKSLSISEALSRIQAAVTVWIETSERGHRAWNYSCEDFNIGDLTSYLEDKDLIKQFKLVGINKLDIITNCFESDTDWHYDTVLADTSLLNLAEL